MRVLNPIQILVCLGLSGASHAMPLPASSRLNSFRVTPKSVASVQRKHSSWRSSGASSFRPSFAVVTSAQRSDGGPGDSYRDGEFEPEPYRSGLERIIQQVESPAQLVKYLKAFSMIDPDTSDSLLADESRMMWHQRIHAQIRHALQMGESPNEFEERVLASDPMLIDVGHIQFGTHEMMEYRIFDAIQTLLIEGRKQWGMSQCDVDHLMLDILRFARLKDLFRKESGLKDSIPQHELLLNLSERSKIKERMIQAINGVYSCQGPESAQTAQTIVHGIRSLLFYFDGSETRKTAETFLNALFQPTIIRESSMLFAARIVEIASEQPVSWASAREAAQYFDYINEKVLTITLRALTSALVKCSHQPYDKKKSIKFYEILVREFGIRLQWQQLTAASNVEDSDRSLIPQLGWYIPANNLHGGSSTHIRFRPVSEKDQSALLSATSPPTNADTTFSAEDKWYRD